VPGFGGEMRAPMVTGTGPFKPATILMVWRDAQHRLDDAPLGSDEHKYLTERVRSISEEYRLAVEGRPQRTPRQLGRA
jgi:hypothetical protein